MKYKKKERQHFYVLLYFLDGIVRRPLFCREAATAAVFLFLLAWHGVCVCEFVICNVATMAFE